MRFLRDFNHYPLNKKECTLPYNVNSLTKSSNKIKKNKRANKFPLQVLCTSLSTKSMKYF